MVNIETISFLAALISLLLATLFYVIALVRRSADASHSGHVLAGIGLAFLLMSVSMRAAITGHGPFSNMYEFSIAFSLGTVAASLYFQWRYKTALLTAIGVLIALGFLLYASSLPSRPVPLVPALQQSLLLTLHVTTAMIAYGTFAIAFGAALLYLLQARLNHPLLPDLQLLDDIGYRAIALGFPFMTLVIILGALWAEVAWGTYWSWDPKETASLITWLMYAGYLHARLLRNWRGERSAFLLILGFVAVIFTYFGNYFFGGLHSYA